MRLIDLAGQKFERVQVVSRAPNMSETDTNARWNCKCDCGKEFIAYGQDIRRGKTKSCGCLTRKTMGDRSRRFNTRHGMSQTRAFRIWGGMLNRCTNSNDPKYRYYGGRGIKVCERWLKFENFLSDMGFPPDDLSLDRIDTDGDYRKENCRWATKQEQAINRRSSVMLTHNGITMTATDWARALGLSASTMYGRVAMNWPPEKMFAKNMKKHPIKESP